MIKMMAFYRNQPGARFDHAYYAGKHADMVHRLLKPMGLIKFEVHEGTMEYEPGSKPQYITVASVAFETEEALRKAFDTHKNELLGDVPNFTNLEPELQLCKVLL
ncbi:MAG: EthD family reductase [Chloroflexi bacterium]|nr:EthD family reductase [Chloroflexota bacterium]